MRALVRSATLSGYAELAGSRGLDADRLMVGAGLDPVDLTSPANWIPAASVGRLLADSATASGDDGFAIELAQRRRLSTLGPISLVLREEPLLRDALGLLIRYERSYNEALHMQLTEADGLVTVRLWLELGEPAPTDQALRSRWQRSTPSSASSSGPAGRPSRCASPRRPPTTSSRFTSASAQD